MVQKLMIAVLMVFCIALTACSKDAEFNTFMTEFDSLTNDIVKKVDANPTSAGVDDAQKVLDDKKAGLKTKLTSLKEARGFQVSKETTEKFTKDLTDNANKIVSLMTSHMDAAIKDPKFMDKMKKLTSDYTGMLQ